MSPPKPVRVRKARRSGTCSVCRRLVLVGELIASVGGGPFVHIGHIGKQDTDPEDIMSNRRKLKLRPATLPYTPAATDVALDQPRPGDRCEFHPGCCDPEDTICQGCGAEAVGALTFRREHEAAPARRTPFCAEHGPLIAEGLRAVQLRMSASQN